MRRRRARAASVLAALAVVAAACTGDGIGIELGSPTASGSVTPSPGSTSLSTTSPGITLDVEPVETDSARAAAAMAELCVPPKPTPTDDDGAPSETPPDVAEVESQVEQVRQLEFLRRVAVQPVSADEIARKLEGAFDDTYPEEFYDRRTVAWQTIGVIPRDVTIRDALLAYYQGPVIGFYNPVDGELVYEADGDLGVIERLTLAHELTHALDDQHFDLSRMDRLAASCRDEDFEASLGAVEGSAQYFATLTLFRFPPADGDFSGLGDGGGMPGAIPPFMSELLLWPYTAGEAFITDLDARGGVEEVDGALRRFPVTTEQILHPDRFPSDTPSRVDVPDLTADLGPGWGDLDVMQVGEAWLAAMLSLRLDDSTADAAAAGWDGGVYRAFTDGHDALVVFDTAWDSQADADAFEQAMREWLAAGDTNGEVAPGTGRHVRFAVATHPDLLAIAAS